jgi:type IV pilus assembly protein PilB
MGRCYIAHALPATPTSRQNLEEMLLKLGAIDEQQLERARDEKRRFGGEVGRILVDLGYISEEFLLRAMSRQLGLPLVDPANDPLDPEAVRRLQVALCERHGVIAVGGDPAKKVMRIATSEPTNDAELRVLQTVTGCRVEPVIATSASISRAIRKYFYGESKNKQQAIARVSTLVGGGGNGTGPSGLKMREAPPQPLEVTPEAVLAARLLRLEEQLEPLAVQLDHMAARVQRLEQAAQTKLRVIKVLGDILVEKGMISREEYMKRVRREMGEP